jgi:hypothetical protein
MSLIHPSVDGLLIRKGCWFAAITVIWALDASMM